MLSDNFGRRFDDGAGSFFRFQTYGKSRKPEDSGESFCRFLFAQTVGFGVKSPPLSGVGDQVFF